MTQQEIKGFAIEYRDYTQVTSDLLLEVQNA